MQPVFGRGVLEIRRGAIPYVALPSKKILI